MPETIPSSAVAAADASDTNHTNQRTETQTDSNTDIPMGIPVTADLEPVEGIPVGSVAPSDFSLVPYQGPERRASLVDPIATLIRQTRELPFAYRAMFLEGLVSRATGIPLNTQIPDQFTPTVFPRVRTRLSIVSETLALK